MMKYYNIRVLSDKTIFVTVLSTEMTSVYWSMLVKDLASLKIGNSIVFFDFMVRNGVKDRFYSTYLREDYSVECSLQKCRLNLTLKHQADDFFLTHQSYVNKSVLTDSQKAAYLNKLNCMKLYRRL